MHRPRLLIVEDGEDQLRWLAAVFKDQFDVFTADTGRKAQLIFSEYQHSIDAIILDVRLPDMTAFELLNSLEKLCFPSIPPTIIQTEYDDQTWMEKLFGEFRAITYLIKPYDEEEIIAAVDKAMRADPFVYKGLQDDERMTVLMSLYLLKDAITDKLLHMPKEFQAIWLPKLQAVFNPDQQLIPTESIPGSTQNTFKLKMSLFPILEIAHATLDIPFPEKQPVRLGVHPEVIPLIQGGMDHHMDEFVFEVIEVESPTPEMHLDFWVARATSETMSQWERVTRRLDDTTEKTLPLYGIAIIPKDDRDLMAKAILQGASYGVFESEWFIRNFQESILRLVRRRYELRSLAHFRQVLGKG